MKTIFGVYEITDGVLLTGNENVYSYDDDDITINICGYLCCRKENKSSDGMSVKRLFNDHDRRITEYLNGVYILVIYDKKTKNLHIYHDQNTSALTLYYTILETKVFYSTSIKKLLKESGIKRSLNNETVSDFIVNGFINGSQTLIYNVFKIKINHALHASQKKVEQTEVQYELEQLSENQAIDNWSLVLDNAINSCLDDQNEINMALSAGYDSNCILHSLKKNKEKKIHTFSVGGSTGKSELVNVKKILQSYPDVTLQETVTDNTTLQSLPDIVWRLEGTVYEYGVFLQYTLANMVNQAKVKHFICGECADQVMNIHYNDKVFMPVNPQPDNPHKYSFKEEPLVFASLLILKKNGIMFNSFDIETRYPFLDKRFVAVANGVKNLNGTSKEFHKNKCREILSKEIMENIEKAGGATDCYSLFADRSAIKKYTKLIERSELYKHHQKLISAILLRRIRDFISSSDPGTSAKQKRTFFRFIKKITGSISALRKHSLNRVAYSFLETRLRVYINLHYIMLFEKLFISGEYDEKFGDAGIDISLPDIMVNKAEADH